MALAIRWILRASPQRIAASLSKFGVRQDWISKKPGLREEDDEMRSKRIIIVLGLLFGPTSIPVSTAHVSSRIDLPVAVAYNSCDLRVIRNLWGWDAAGHRARLGAAYLLFQVAVYVCVAVVLYEYTAQHTSTFSRTRYDSSQPEECRAESLESTNTLLVHFHSIR
jgi:hypothetical protein